MSPHDLLRLAPGTPNFSDAPAWVAASLKRAPFVVVRRAVSLNGLIAVGVRGETRSERFGSWLDPRYVELVLRPEALRNVQALASRSMSHAFTLLEAIAPLCDATGYVWGPTGSVGFELASGCPTVTQTSDLDLLMRVPERLNRTTAKTLFDALTQAALDHGTHVDMQIQTQDAAFSLAEFAHPGSRVMLRCADGPKLVADPWQTSCAA
ncbi:malonate decarboxylase holo-ACP synthase [Caballeronia sp. SEWSISQ10-4 2]|uniref:malonate decarboxylase holo-ACP synthase n=1 Tax=Caballeronia sp. SEWSISQ10-4 2 TaxID=2937438 RepID=UPI00264FAE9B|nr:malonate decarboxylase holo-ACP synthase [Caballeronia sp. SEWSISQ10-4 2]MDN7183052.1 malonate decarboxylase holo-ACP synthase [Caballeronia sp. SEWSISQ10-4 2]